MEETNRIDHDKLCKWCGEELKQPEGICPKCDVEDNGNKAISKTRTENNANSELFENVVNVALGPKGEGHDWFITLLLCFFVGFLGVHRFYTGNTMIGVGQLLTFGGCGLWTMIDFFLIITNTYKDGKGIPLVRSNVRIQKN